jgi:hypothetical protein
MEEQAQETAPQIMEAEAVVVPIRLEQTEQARQVVRVVTVKQLVHS